MSSSFELATVDLFAPNVVGVPGARTFFLQVVSGTTALAFKCEKQHVEALASALTGLLGDLPPVEVVPMAGSVDVTPAPPQWIVGSIALGYEAPDDRIVVILEEQETDEDRASARFALTRAQARYFVEQGGEIVSGGRPSCMLCTSPIDPLGYTCPCFN
jgi:uncharacterized repeat protein (TIGR03847 family)